MDITQLLKKSRNMKVQIRQGVFETNSSSTHVLSLFKKEVWDKFKNNDTDEFFMDWWDTRELFSIDDLRKKYEEQCKEDNAEPSDEDFQEWLEEKMEECEFYNYDKFREEYEILTEEVPDSQYVAVSIWGYE
jgi:hypothetical protein